VNGRRGAAWRAFVDRRRPELLAVFPGAAPTRLAACPRHGAAIGPVTAMCLDCHRELFEMLAAEYVGMHGHGDEELPAS
jgi:hypothetical protein